MRPGDDPAGSTTILEEENEMARRKSEAATILNFFRNATVETAQFTFDLVRDVMKERVPKKERAKKGKKAKAVGAAVPIPGAPVEE